MQLLGGDLHAAHRRTDRRSILGSAHADNSSPSHLLGGRLGDERGFVHKRLLGAVGGFLAGGPAGAVSGFIRGGKQPAFQGIQRGVPGVAAIPQRASCPPGFFETPAGGCQEKFIAGRILEAGQAIFPGAPGVNGGGVSLAAAPSLAADPVMMGEAVTGQFGAGFEPDVFSTTTRRCSRNHVLGSDGVCYNRRDLRNSERFWPRGRRPLMTGGDVRAISIANSAAKRLQKKQKQLEAMGMLKKKTCPKPKQLLPGHTVELAHASEH